MNPLRLRLANYRCFDDLDLDLPTGCVAVLGENGAGKSSIVSAIDLAIFGPESRSLADYHSDTAAPDEELLIELVFEHAGATYKVRRTFSARGRGKSILDFERLMLGDRDMLGILAGGPASVAGLREDEREAIENGGWEPLTCESAKATQELIEQTIGLSRETFRASAFLAQGDGAAFTEAQPRDRKRILAEVLGLSRWDVLRDRNRVELRQLEKSLNEAAGRVGAARELAATKADVLVAHADAHAAELDHADTLADREREHQELGQRWQQAREQAARRQAAEAELTAARAARAHLETLHLVAEEAVTAHAFTTDELEQLPGGEELEQLQQRISALEAEVADHERRAREHTQAAQEAGQVAKRLTGLAERAAESDRFAADVRARASILELADEAVCQTCGQHVADEAKARAIAAYLDEAAGHEASAARDRAEAAATEVPVVPPPPASAPPVAELEAARARVRSLVDAAAQRARLQERLVALQQTIATRPAQEQLDEARAAVDAKQLALVGLAPVNIDELEQQGLAAKRAVDQAKVAFDAARNQRARLEEKLAQIKIAEEQIDAAEQEGAKVAGDIEVVAQLDRAFSPDGIPALIVENSAIPYLETEATRILADLGTSFRVELRTQAALKSGDGVRDTLDVVIQTQESERPYETFSGGERTRLNLALRIALARLLAHRRGAESRLLCIDEPEFLDEQGTAALVDVLRGLQDDFDKLYIVSHVPGLRDSFDQTLTVSKDDAGVSHVLEAGVFEEAIA